MRCRFLIAVVAASALATSGCAAYYPVETSPATIRRSIEPGDTVRVAAGGDEELRLLVTAIDDRRMRGHVEGRGERSAQFELDAIESLEVERLSMRRALLTIVLPVVAGAIIACNVGDCRARSSLDARY
jgi:hypothetical protein